MKHMEARQRISREFFDFFSTPPKVVAYAPGRLEILGNHTDYNQGLVLSAAIDRGTFFAVAPSTLPESDDRCRIHDLRTGETVEFRLQDLNHPPVAGEWTNYIKGIIVELQQRSWPIPPFQAAIRSTIPLSAGMSSSAALEVATTLALGRLVRADLSKLEIARIGQSCENNYVGAQTGLLDQFTSLHGRAGHFVFSDFRSLRVETIPVPVGTSLVVANSMVRHVLTGAYNQRRARCEEAVKKLAPHLPGLVALRDLSTAQLEQYRRLMELTTYRRALHVVGENERVQQGIKALENNDLAGFGKLLYRSHQSSRRNFENSCPELDTLVELGQSLPGIIGARLSGGGFGGIVVYLVDETQAENFTRRLETAWHSRTGNSLQPIICQTADGGTVV